ncbi:hypothetical protein D9M70_414640 [compost metagenome]
MQLIAMAEQQQVGDMRVGHQRIARLADRQPRAAGGDLRQPGIPQRSLFGAERGEQRHADQHGIHQRLGQAGIAALLGEQDEVQLAQAQAAVGLRHGEGGQAEFGELAPEFGTAPAVALPQLADALGGDLVEQEIPDVGLEQQLVRAEAEVHGLLLRRAACRACVRR